VYARKIIDDYKRARDGVFPSLLNARKEKRDPFADPLVQDAQYLPGFTWGSLVHAIFLFLLEIYMKGGITSTTAIQQMTKLYNRHPELFDPNNFLNSSPGNEDEMMEKVSLALGNNGLGSNIEDSTKTWVRNMHKLARHWGGNPLLLFEEVNLKAEKTWKSYRIANKVYNNLCKKLMRKPSWSEEYFADNPFGFYGFQHKMVSMILYFYIHAGMVKPCAYPVPVDFHILRVLTSSGILRIPGLESGSECYRESLLPYARKVTLRYVVDTGVASEHLADVLWLLSRSFCRRHPGNKSSVDKVRRGRRREITELPVVWTETAVRTYDRTCGRCPIENLCEWNIPSSNYYVKGKIRWRSERAKPPQLELLQMSPVKILKNGKHNNGVREPKVLEPIRQLSVFD
jgi:hypothetical protein